ncbi:MAG: hypothetical protein O6766_09790 [Gammaproteobacteria bacterium]|nr:hypothetical protein [Gammaproteobacteria bacterium]
MSDEGFSPIRPKSVPLSHATSSAAPPADTPSLSNAARKLAIGAILLASLLAVFLVVPDLIEPPRLDSTAQPAAPIPVAPAAVSNTDQLPPFEALMREQARERAQEELAAFVELQMALEKKMQVGTWGQEDYDAAKLLATSGDENFLIEKFDESLIAYRTASQALAALIEKGEALLEETIVAGERALLEKDQGLALVKFSQALLIDPANSRAKEGVARAEILPDVVRLMREGKNQELSENWQDALQTYKTVQTMDSKTNGLSQALADAREGATRQQVSLHLSDGFSALNASRFKTAKQAFARALKLSPANPIAIGGLEQVAEQTDLSELEALRLAAVSAESNEQWQSALENYEAVLQRDANLQFAKEGRLRASAQRRAEVLLGNIMTSPDKLSSTELFDQARDILAKAELLEPRGIKLSEQIEAVTSLVRIYSTPVDVTFRSDNLTQVTLSTIGRLGAFAEKQLRLRPGAYTVIGSRDGCRDVRAKIIVRAEMQPIDIRCNENL